MWVNKKILMENQVHYIDVVESFGPGQRVDGLTSTFPRTPGSSSIVLSVYRHEPVEATVISSFFHGLASFPPWDDVFTFSPTTRFQALTSQLGSLCVLFKSSSASLSSERLSRCHMNELTHQMHLRETSRQIVKLANIKHPRSQRDFDFPDLVVSSFDVILLLLFDSVVRIGHATRSNDLISFPSTRSLKSLFLILCAESKNWSDMTRSRSFHIVRPCFVVDSRTRRPCNQLEERKRKRERPCLQLETRSLICVSISARSNASHRQMFSCFFFFVKGFFFFCTQFILIFLSTDFFFYPYLWQSIV